MSYKFPPGCYLKWNLVCLELEWNESQSSVPFYRGTPSLGAAGVRGASCQSEPAGLEVPRLKV